MSTTPPSPHDLAQRLRWGTPQPELTGLIRACPCAPELKAGLFLMNHDLDEAHRIAQGCTGALGARWHALMHRHEPDLPNSKYWLRKVGESPIYPQLVLAVEKLGKAEGVATDGKWEPERFTDQYGQGQDGDWTRDLDALEIRTLLDWCLKQEPR